MKPLNIKWPDGATHYVPCNIADIWGIFYKVVHEAAVSYWPVTSYGVREHKMSPGSDAGRWKQADAIKRPTERTVEWDGVSVPPAGTECEYRVGRGGWFKCSIRYVTTPYRDCPVEVVMYANHLGGEQTGVVGSGEGELEFRSIRTQEQIAAEERMTSAYAMCAIAPSLSNVDAVALYDALYRKQVES